MFEMFDVLEIFGNFGMFWKILEMFGKLKLLKLFDGPRASRSLGGQINAVK